MAALFRPDPPDEVARRRLEQLAAQWRTGEPDAESDGPPCPPRDDSCGRHAARPVAARTRLSARLAETLPGRWATAIGPAHVAVLALVCAAAMALTAWWVLAHRAGTPTVDPPTLATVPAPETIERSSRSTGQPTAQGKLVVDVAGKVRRPGIVTLPPGSRVVDAIEAAGGARDGVELTSLNLARLLVDGEQVLVGYPPVGGTTTGTTPGSLVNLNSATVEQLETLPGVGPVTAQAILDWRTEHGSFTSVDELLEVDGIGDATLADLRDLVTV